MGKRFLLLLLVCLSVNCISQETYRLRLEIPLFNYDENVKLPYRYPSMDQALEWSGSMYGLGFWGIDELGNFIFKQPSKPYSGWRKAGNNAFRYLAGLAFARFGSELPIPLGIWGHEEFHRAVLGTGELYPRNGNWIFSKWDGTVYGISDDELAGLKVRRPDILFYSYVSGLQYEVTLNQRVTLDDFYHRKTFPRSALLLYDAWYVWDYFRFATSASSDSAKLLAPPHESSEPSQRDFSGSDLNAWVYDMFNPALSYLDRDPFPGGSGVNRRIGFSELTSSQQSFLENQKKLSLINLLNPAIFFINRISINQDFSFNLFATYMPTHFGNDIAVYLPVKLRYTGILLNMHRYGNYESNGLGFGLGLFDGSLTGKLSTDILVTVWDQPESLFNNEKVVGGSAEVALRYSITDNFSGFVSANAKTRGWAAGNPYLDENFSVRIGINYELK